MKKSGFLSNAIILTIGGILAKVFSAVYRILLTRILGGEGIGIYQLVFPLYSLFVVLATSGLPMAISKIIAKNIGNEKAVIKKCLLLTMVFSLCLTLILLFLGNIFSKIQQKSSLTICYAILAPTIIILSAGSVLRGYFQGVGNFNPSAISSIFEQFVKMITGLILSISLISLGLIYAIIGAVVGIAISETVSLLILIVYYKKHRKNLKNTHIKIKTKDILIDVLPITITSIIMPISSFVDSLIVVNLLCRNFSQTCSIFLYGLESGAVSSLISLPTIFSFAIASVVLPNLSIDIKKFNKNNSFNFALKIVLIITIPFVLYFLLVPNRIITFLYSNKLNDLGLNGTNISSRLLAISSLGIVFVGVNQIFSSSLQAENRRIATIKNMIFAVAVKLILELIFIPTKALNIYSLSIANVVCYMIVAVLNGIEIKRVFAVDIEYNFYKTIIFASICLLLTMVAIMSINTNLMTTIIAGLMSISVYVFVLFKGKVFSKKDIAKIKYKI